MSTRNGCLASKKSSPLFSVESKWLVHQIVANNGPAIPKGLNHSARGWPILRGLPWVAAFELFLCFFRAVFVLPDGAR
jgi:hypothetical protein